MKTKGIVALLLIVVTLLLSACETTKGFGRDLQRVGRWVEELAD